MGCNLRIQPAVLLVKSCENEISTADAWWPAGNRPLAAWWSVQGGRGCEAVEETAPHTHTPPWLIVGMTAGQVVNNGVLTWKRVQSVTVAGSTRWEVRRMGEDGMDEYGWRSFHLLMIQTHFLIFHRAKIPPDDSSVMESLNLSVNVVSLLPQRLLFLPPSLPPSEESLSAPSCEQQSSGSEHGD